MYLLGRFKGMLLRNFFKCCNLLCYEVYLDENLTLIIAIIFIAGTQPGFGRGAKNFLQILKYACGEAMRFARGVWGHAFPRKFL